MKPLIAALTLSLGLVAATAVQAALVDRGGGLIYDTDLNLTWLADANAHRPASPHNNGLMIWSEAIAWADNLAYGGYTDWRLPTTLQPDATCGVQSGGVSVGYNCTGSEMGHLFYNELGGVAGQSITTTHNTNYNLFQNIQSYGYWSGTEYAPDPATLAWSFVFALGYQSADVKAINFGSPSSYYNYAWAVRSGDVAAVPLPATAWLFASGLLGLLGAARARRRN